MTLPVTGALSFNAINTELNKTATAQLSLDDVDYRSLAGGQTAGTPTSLSVQYGATFNGAYFFPRQTATWNVSSQSPTRSNSRIILTIGSNGSISWSADGTLINNTGPSRWYTPLTTNIANSYQVNINQTGWTVSGPGSWAWVVFLNNGGLNAGTMTATASSNWGWSTMNGFTDIYFRQGLVSPGAAFDATATGNIQIRPTATPSNVVNIPFNFRIFAL